MKDPSRQPTSLELLEKLIETRDNIGDEDVQQTTAWLTWTYNFLSARKLYHKKASMKTAILKRMAETLLSKDELDAIDAEAEKQLGNLEDEDASGPRQDTERAMRKMMEEAYKEDIP